MTRKNVSSGSKYEPIVGFSRAVRIGNTIAVSGTAPIGPDGNVAGTDAASQTRCCLDKIVAAVEQAGGKREDIIRTRIFMTRASDWLEIGRVHGEVFADVRPASTMAVVAALVDPEWLVEIEADAVLGG
jgi:enamine deaminase RidA (YjgF/YER057c/UK114 family)